MGRAIWLALTVILMGASFWVGRFGGGPHSLPTMVATLPGEEAGFSREFNDRVSDRFPVGSSEDDLIAYLVSENFEPSWRRRDGANVSVLALNGLICKKIIKVSWQADASGTLKYIGGDYESRCI